MINIKKNFWTGKNGPLMIAEIGGNHEGNFTYAKKLTKNAIDSGASSLALSACNRCQRLSTTAPRRPFG